MRHSILLAIALAASIPAPASAASALQVRFHPSTQVYSHELDHAHGVQSVVVQNLAVVNSGPEAVDIDRVVLELRSEGGVLQTQQLAATDLDRVAASTRSLADAHLLERLSFQFRPDRLLGDGVTLSASHRLGAGEAVLVAYRTFAYRGKAERLRAVVEGRDGKQAVVRADAELPVKQEAAQGYLFPLAGHWYVGAGSSFHTAHRWGVPEEFALDLLRVDGAGRAFRGKGTRLRDYYAYGATVRAARAGRVIAVANDAAEAEADLQQARESKADYLQRVMQAQMARLSQGTTAVAGNHVIVDHGDGTYATYAHLKTRSVVVKLGQTVGRGQALGELGSSGNSTMPHLHFQVCDAPDALMCAGIPVAFDKIELPLADGPRTLQSGDFVDAL